VVSKSKQDKEQEFLALYPGCGRLTAVTPDAHWVEIDTVKLFDTNVPSTCGKVGVFLIKYCAECCRKHGWLW
jgi:hypothetical protein